MAYAPFRVITDLQIFDCEPHDRQSSGSCKKVGRRLAMMAVEEESSQKVRRKLVGKKFVLDQPDSEGPLSLT